MRVLKKLALSAALASLTTLSAQAAFAPYNESGAKVKAFNIELDVDTKDGAHIVVGEDSDHKVIELSKEALSDPAQVDAALADLPEDVREKVKSALNGIDIDGHKFAFKVDGENSMEWFGSDGDKKVMIIDIDDEATDNDGVKQKVIKKFIHTGSDKHAVIELKHGAGISADSLIQLISKGEFSQEDLDKLQQALDAKR